MTKKHADAVTASAAIKAAAEKESADLKKQLSDLQTSSAKNLADVQAQLKKSNDELVGVNKKLADAMNAKVMEMTQ